MPTTWATSAHLKVDLSYLPGVASGMSERVLAASPVIVRMRARRAGTSTLAQSESFLKGRLCLMLDDLETRDQARMAGGELSRRAPRPTLSEVQREPELLLAAKRVVDDDRLRRNCRFVPTGSANLLLRYRVSETLAGRPIYVSLWPLTRRERLGLGAPGSGPSSCWRPWRRGSLCLNSDHRCPPTGGTAKSRPRRCCIGTRRPISRSTL